MLAGSVMLLTKLFIKINKQQQKNQKQFSTKQRYGISLIPTQLIISRWSFKEDRKMKKSKIKKNCKN